MKSSKKLLSLILSLIMIVILAPVPAQAFSDFENGSGTSGDPYQIATPEQLNKVRYYLDKNFILIGDIILSADEEWQPIGSFTGGQTPFTGTFDGDGYTISNMTIGTASAPSTLAEVGLFGYVNAATIKDVNLSNISIYAAVDSNTFLCAGGIAGQAFDSTISGCCVEGQISGSCTLAVSNSRGVGGISGLSTSDISNCTSSVMITAGGSGLPVGGLVGLSSSGAINNCSASGTVTGGQYTGGLIGYASGSGTVANSYATADVSGATDSDVGGLIGENWANIESCFALGDVAGGTAGGLIGLGRAGSIKNSFAVGNVSASLAVGGLVGGSYSNGLSAISNCYASGNIETTQTSPVNQNAGGLVGYFNTAAGTTITAAYWNSDATQVVGGTSRTAAAKIGIDRTPGVSTAKSWDEMTDVAFAELLNTNNGELKTWTSVYGINGGYPYLDGLYFVNPATYQVEFHSDDVIYKKMNIEQDGTVIAPLTVPTKDRYDFVDWYPTSNGSGDPFDFGSAISDNTFIYAKWVAQTTYSVTYNANGGEGTVPVDTAEYIKGETLTLPSGDGLSKANAIFAGWTLLGDESETVYGAEDTYIMGAANAVFYAKWTPCYTVSYDLNGGIGTAPVDSNSYKQNDTVTMKSGDGLSKENAVFAGWTLSNDGTGTVYGAEKTYTMGGANVVFHAKWAPLHTISYDLNGGTGTVPVDGNRYTQGQEAWLASGEGLINGSLKFGGWVDEEGKVYNPENDVYTMGTGDVTFYAKWTNYWTDFVDIEADAPEWDEESNTYTIDNAMELAWVAYIVNNGIYDFEDAQIRIADSVTALDLSGHEWIPIGNYDRSFSGNFDGSYKKIINLIIGTAETPDMQWSEAGLFGRVDNAAISNVCLANLTIYSEAEYAELGGLIGEAANCRITNSYATGTISSNSEETTIGGLLGYNCQSTVSDCHAAVDITGGEYTCAGGLLGFNDCSELSESYATGNVSGGDFATVGGLIGFDIGGLIKNNYATGDVSGGSNACVGGLIGREEISTISFGYWNSDAIQTLNGEIVDIKTGIGYGDASTTAKTAEEMKTDDFAGLLNENRLEEMTSTWAIVSAVNNSYPVLANTVSFNKNGGDTEAIPASKTTALGEPVGTLPTAPQRNGYSFDGWYTEPECDHPFNIATPITASISLYAKWTQNTSSSHGSATYIPTQYPVTDINQDTQAEGQIKLSSERAGAGETIIITVTPNRGYENGMPTVLDKNGNPVSVTDNGDGSFRFKMPAGEVTVGVKFTKIGYFDDINEEDWFGEAAWFCAANGLLAGTGNRLFGSNAITDRAMLVTVLYRLTNSSESLENIFADVEDGKWYTEAVAWAAHNHIVEGYSDGKFGPTDILTREQMAAILYRYSEFMKYDLSKLDQLQDFSDASDISAWAVSGMQWAVGNGIMEGMGGGIISPKSGATRAQFAVMMQRFYTSFAN